MDGQEQVACPCCGGAGEHEVRPHITASPEDFGVRCDFCFGQGSTSIKWAMRFREQHGCGGARRERLGR